MNHRRSRLSLHPGLSLLDLSNLDPDNLVRRLSHSRAEALRRRHVPLINVRHGRVGPATGLVRNNQLIKTAMAEEHRPARDREDDTSVGVAMGRPIEVDRKYFSIEGKTKQDMEKSEGVSCRLDWSGRGGEARIRMTARQHKQQTKQHMVTAHINRQWPQ